MNKTKTIYNTVRSAKFVLKPNSKQKEIFNILEKVYSRLSSELSKQSFKTLLEYPELKQFLN